VLQIPSLAQSKKYFVITGKIMPETENTGGGNGSIEITKNGKETTNTAKEGDFVVKNPTDEPEKWLRVGTAFLNKDGSLNVKLDVIPVSGVVRIGGVQ
jgi:hypothetical protein